MKHSVIALTGGIGCGKSLVANYLRQKGFVTIDCDVLSRQVANDPVVISQVQALLGNDCVIDGKLDREKIRNIVFADGNLHSLYSQLFYERIKQLLEEFISKSSAHVFVEIPIIDAFEFDWTYVWLILRDDDTRIKSVMQRDNVSKQNVENIISRQKQCANFTDVITNNGSVSQVHSQIDKLLEKYNLNNKG